MGNSNKLSPNMEMKTKSIADENIEKIKALFPNCVTEAKDEKTGEIKHVIDFDQLRQELSNEVVEGPQERYQFTWPEKRKSILLANASTTNVLRPKPEKSVDFENTKNIYIEGDNLETLKILRETYMDKIKMIYIDPPYNTGNDFVYEDDFKSSNEEYLKAQGSVDEAGEKLQANNETNGRFHTNWLNMLYPRLLLARDFLSDDGVIFISIDDNEQANLKRICDEIFGEQNFITNLIWQSTGGSNTGSSIVTITEYILVYAKNKNSLKIKLREKKDDNYLLKDEFLEKRGKYYLQKLDGKFTPSHYSESLNYPITYKGKVIWPGGNSQKSNELWNWRWSKNKVEWGILNGFIEFIDNKDNTTTVKFKNYELVDNNGNPRQNSVPPKNVIGSDISTTSMGTTEMYSLFGNDFFPFPKSTKLISYLINLIDFDSGFVMDFFSGSGTTASAVINSNLNDHGSRKFIMVQLPELCNDQSEAFKQGYKTICDIGEERIRRCGKLLKDKDPKLDVGFRVLKIDSSNMQNVFYTPQKFNVSTITGESAIKEDRNPLDLLFNVMLELGITLDSKIQEKEFKGKKYYLVNDNDLIGCFEKNVDEEMITMLSKLQPLTVAFRDDSFENDQTNVNCEQIFKQLSPATKIKII